LENRRLRQFAYNRLVKEGRRILIVLILLDLEMERLFGDRGNAGVRLSMTATHHRRVQPLFDHLAYAGFEHGLTAHQGSPLGLIVEISLDPIGLFLREQA
jgi:hypothetical protein